MTDALFHGLFSVAMGIVGIGLLAVLVGRNSNTAGVITASGKALGSAIKAAQSPVLSGGPMGFGGLGQDNVQGLW